jgi:hypothetical protein
LLVARLLLGQYTITKEHAEAGVVDILSEQSTAIDVMTLFQSCTAYVDIMENLQQFGTCGEFTCVANLGSLGAHGIQLARFGLDRRFTTMPRTPVLPRRWGKMLLVRSASTIANLIISPC